MPHFYKTMIIITICLLLFTSAASATEYILNTASMEQFKNGINYSGKDNLIIRIDDSVAIRSNSNAGINSTVPVTIRSPSGNTLTIIAHNDSEMVYGIRAPSVSIESGRLDITVNGQNEKGGGNAFGICAESGNVSISGGSTFITVETECHKNKGIYASHFIIITDGMVKTSQQGGKNTFGLDGGEVAAQNADGGVMISGGQIEVRSGRGTERNICIDSKFGAVEISGNPVIMMHVNKNGANQNYAYNTDITDISGGNPVIFTSEGGNYTLRRNAVLAQNATLIPGRTFEIPVGRTLGIAEGISLLQPSDTSFLFGKGFGTFEYARILPGEAGAVIYEGKEPAPRSPFPIAGLFAGLGAAVLLRRKK